MASTFYTYAPLLDTTPVPYDKPGYVCEVNGSASAAVQGHPASQRSVCGEDVKAEQDVSRFLGSQDCGYDASPDEDLIFTQGMLMNFMDNDDSLLPNFRSNTTSDHQAAEDVSQQCFFPFSQQGTQASTEHMSSRNARPIPGGHLTRTTLNFDELESVVSGGSRTSFDDSARDLTMNCPANLFNNNENSSHHGSTRQLAHLARLESQNSADASYLSYGGVMPESQHSTRSRFPAAVTTPQSNRRPARTGSANCDASLFSGGTISRSGGVWPKPHQSKEARKHKKAIAAKKYRQERNEYVKELENKNQELNNRVTALEAQLRDFLMASQATAERRHQQ